jgi:hypothetical protein
MVRQHGGQWLVRNLKIKLSAPGAEWFMYSNSLNLLRSCPSLSEMEFWAECCRYSVINAGFMLARFAVLRKDMVLRFHVRQSHYCPTKDFREHAISQLRAMWLDKRSLSIEVLMADQEVKRDELFWLA